MSANNRPTSYQWPPKLVTYNSRNFREDLKIQLKQLGLIHAKNLEEMVNWAIELGIDRLKRGDF